MADKDVTLDKGHADPIYTGDSAADEEAAKARWEEADRQHEAAKAALAPPKKPRR